MEFVRLEYDNNKATNSELNGHQEVIKEYIPKDYKYIGFIPVKFGASGKTLSIDLMFEKSTLNIIYKYIDIKIYIFFI